MNGELNTDAVMKNLRDAFGPLRTPERITTKCDCDDKEREQVERHFKGMDRNSMSPYDVSMMLIDGALIEPKSYLYFLPRLARDVLYADADAHFLNARMDDLLDIDDLTYPQKNALVQLKKILSHIESRSKDW